MWTTKVVYNKLSPRERRDSMPPANGSSIQNSLRIYISPQHNCCPTTDECNIGNKTSVMPLPLTVSCFSKIQIGFTFLVPAHLGSPSKRAIKRMCVCVLSHKAIPIFPYKTVWDRWNKASTTKPSLIGPAVSIQHLLVTDGQKDSPHISGGWRWLSRRQPACL